MNESIYCPLCSRKIGEYNWRSTIPKVIDCRKCNKRIIYTQKKGTEIKAIPPRNTASGVTFH